MGGENGIAGSTPATSTIAPESGQDGGHDRVVNTINSGMRIVSLEQTKSRSAVNKIERREVDA